MAFLGVPLYSPGTCAGWQSYCKNSYQWDLGELAEWYPPSGSMSLKEKKKKTAEIKYKCTLICCALVQKCPSDRWIAFTSLIPWQWKLNTWKTVAVWPLLSLRRRKTTLVAQQGLHALWFCFLTTRCLLQTMEIAKDCSRLHSGEVTHCTVLALRLSLSLTPAW